MLSCAANCAVCYSLRYTDWETTRFAFSSSHLHFTCLPVCPRRPRPPSLTRTHPRRRLQGDLSVEGHVAGTRSGPTLDPHEPDSREKSSRRERRARFGREILSCLHSNGHSIRTTSQHNRHWALTGLSVCDCLQVLLASKKEQHRLKFL